MNIKLPPQSAHFINPANLVLEGITKTVDTNINSPNGRPTVEYNGEPVEIFVTKEGYSAGTATVNSLMKVINNGEVIQEGGNIEDQKVALSKYPKILALYDELLK